MLWGTWGVRVLAGMSIPLLAPGVLILSITVSMSVGGTKAGFSGSRNMEVGFVVDSSM